MKVVLLLFVIAAAVLPGVVGLLHRCPSNTTSFSNFHDHCNCQKERYSSIVSITCQRFTTDEILLQAIFPLRDYVIDSLTIKNSGPLTLMSNPFRKLDIHKIVFEEVTFVTVPVFRGFVGLEFSLEELYFVKCRVQHWSWGHGNSFIYLETVGFQSTPLPETLTNDLVFRHFPNKIRVLQINDCSVQTLGSNALQRFPHLERIELNRNKISSIQRSMFPPNARRLKSISLSSNPLSHIADDTFVNLTRLEFLTLSNTRLSTLKNVTFFPVWDQLEEIYFNNIPIQCNCEAKWMLNVPSFKLFRAPRCIQHGKTLDQLTPAEQNALCSR